MTRANIDDALMAQAAFDKLDGLLRGKRWVLNWENPERPNDAGEPGMVTVANIQPMEGVELLERAIDETVAAFEDGDFMEGGLLTGGD